MVKAIKTAGWTIFGAALIAAAIFGEGYTIACHHVQPEQTDGMNWYAHFCFMGVVFVTGIASMLYAGRYDD